MKSCTAKLVHDSQIKVNNKAVNTIRRLQPFATQPDLLASAAAEDLKLALTSTPVASSAKASLQEPTPAGKMYGVMVVKWQGRYAYLAAFSGKLNGQWLQGRFVPPPFDSAKVNVLLDSADRKIKALQLQIGEQKLDENIARLELQAQEIETQFECAREAMIEQHKERKVARHRIRATQETRTVSDSLAKELAKQSQSDRQSRKTLRREYEQERAIIDQSLANLKNKKQAFTEKCRSISQQAQKSYFSLFEVLTHEGKLLNLNELAEGQMPPSGTGECAGAKLLAFAHKHDLEPVSMAEFWWGQTTSGQVRHHGNYYPACRGKCGLLLPRMLPANHLIQTPHIDNASHQSINHLHQFVRIVYEDESLAIVDKPAGYLSVPGKLNWPSVLDWARLHWSTATGPLLVHRLDMDTSGLLLIAKTASAHRLLQHQFEKRTIDKVYQALLERTGGPGSTTSGVVDLPLRVDLEDRPRQIVCHTHGKPATTHWRVIGQGVWSLEKGFVPIDADNPAETELAARIGNESQSNPWHGKPLTRVEFKPATGRTHQLRVHAASLQGLNSPIVGDPLYGKTLIPVNRELIVQTEGDSQIPRRMMLHACSLTLVHPVTGKSLTVDAKTPF